MPAHPLSRCLLFDWGDTLMVDFPEYMGPMVSWPRVELVPHVAETLAALYPTWLLAVATNAAESGEDEIRAALDRVGIARWIDKIYCFHTVGVKKPSPEFFAFILADLGLPAAQVVMVGDDFERDVLGAVRSGIRAVWFNPRSGRSRNGELYQTIHDFRSLPDALGK